MGVSTSKYPDIHLLTNHKHPQLLQQTAYIAAFQQPTNTLHEILVLLHQAHSLPLTYTKHKHNTHTQHIYVYYNDATH
jgi:hypothetical protein